MLHEEPKIIQTSRGYRQANLNDIKRCVKSLTWREKRIASAEVKLAKANPESLTHQRAKIALEERFSERNFTRQRFELLLDYALSHTKTNKNPCAQAAVPALDHIAKCKEDIFLCSVVQGKNSGSNDALTQLISKYEWIINKWTRPDKTPLDKDDATAQGQLGIWDAALRFDATRSLAAFPTVAWNWVYRNTRSRTLTDAPDKKLKSYSYQLEQEENAARIEEGDYFVRKQPKFKYIFGGLA